MKGKTQLHYHAHNTSNWSNDSNINVNSYIKNNVNSNTNTNVNSNINSNVNNNVNSIVNININSTPTLLRLHKNDHVTSPEPTMTIGYCNI